jgi:hypothetical protein
VTLATIMKIIEKHSKTAKVFSSVFFNFLLSPLVYYLIQLEETRNVIAK